MSSRTPRLIVGITGASGAAYGVRLLERARQLGVQTHLVATPAGILNVHHELGLGRAELEALATQAHAPGDVGACIASGSFTTDAMVIAPCSMKTLASVAHGFGDNLLTRLEARQHFDAGRIALAQADRSLGIGVAGLYEDHLGLTCGLHRTQGNHQPDRLLGNRHPRLDRGAGAPERVEVLDAGACHRALARRRSRRQDAFEHGFGGDAIAHARDDDRAAGSDVLRVRAEDVQIDPQLR